MLGLPPDWYKLKPYRARAVIEPRAVLAEFGTIIPDDVEIRVSDSTAMVRYLVLPKRPDGTEDYSEEQLAALVTRDTMIGVVPATIQTGRTRPVSQTEAATETAAERHRRRATRDPIQRVDHELEPWEKRCHALADVLDFHKIINTEEKRRGVEALGAEMVGKLTYYERWIAAFANILFQKGDPDAERTRARRWTRSRRDGRPLRVARRPNRDQVNRPKSGRNRHRQTARSP